MFQFMLRSCLIALVMSSSISNLASGQEKESDEVIQDATTIARSYKPRPGQAHPDFILPSIDGDATIQLSKYRGKKVLLLHFASW